MISTGRDTYMTVWTVTEKDGKVSGRVSTSRKRKDTNEYINSNWNAKFVGTAAEKAKTLKERERIIVKVGNMTIENTQIPAKDDKPATSWLTVTIFDFDLLNATPAPAATQSDELPF